MDATTLVLALGADEIHGKDIYRVSFIGFHLTRKEYTVSQGHVVAVGPGYVDLEIQPDFPTPQDNLHIPARRGPRPVLAASLHRQPDRSADYSR